MIKRLLQWLFHYMGLRQPPPPPKPKYTREQWRRWYKANKKYQRERWWRGRNSPPNLRREDVP